jgi:hypothetical protein
MKPNLIYELVELAISLAQAHLDSGDLEDTLLDMIHKAAQAYQDQTGEKLNLDLIGAEGSL